MPDMKQFCPILSLGKTALAPCKGIECAMFVFGDFGSNQQSGCSLKVIAQTLAKK